VVHAARRRGKSRSRILYWFRTPPGVRVGRAPLDEDAIRLIEEHNPDVEFDWTQILKGQEAVPLDTKLSAPPSGVRQSQGSRQRPARDTRPEGTRRDDRVQSRTRPMVPPGEPETPRPEPEPVMEPADVLLAGSLEDQDVAIAAGDPVPAGGIDDAEEPVAEEASTPAQKRLGPEGLLRLRARHAEVLARISERITEPARRDELKALAERLNPDTWVTDHEVRDGLEQYEAVFDSLRSVVGRRRKRRRRRRSDEHAEGSGTNATVEHPGSRMPEADLESGDDEDEGEL
jgi:hypothetical protein